MTAAARNGLVAFLVALVAVAGGFVYEEFVAPQTLATEAPLPIGGPFTLTDANGATRSAGDFRGKLMLIYFGYSFCPDVCPTTLARMSEALKLLGADAANVAPLFITIDPARDTPAELKRYMANFDPRFVALTGSAAEIARVAGEYRVYYRKAAAAAGGQYSMDHSSVIYLMARDGHYLGHFDPDIGAAAMAAAIRKEL